MIKPELELVVRPALYNYIFRFSRAELQLSISLLSTSTYYYISTLIKLKQLTLRQAFEKNEKYFANETQVKSY